MMTEKSIIQKFRIYFDNADVPTSHYCAVEKYAVKYRHLVGGTSRRLPLMSGHHWGISDKCHH